MRRGEEPLETRLRSATMPLRFVAAFGLALYLAAAAALADVPSPSPAPAPTPTPPFSSRIPVQLSPQVKSVIDMAAGAVSDEAARRKNVAVGEVTYFKRFEMQVRTSPDHYRNIHLRPGTEIQPRGATPSAGRRVRVGGKAQPDGSLNADIITVLSD